jgi:recombination protein RecA
VKKALLQAKTTKCQSEQCGQGGAYKQVSKRVHRVDQPSERQRALENALATIRRQYGEGAVMRMGERAVRDDVKVIPTGVLSLDIALGVGGLPRGGTVELFGSEGSGKTTLALHFLREAQRRGGTVAFIDAEHALSREYAEALGLNLDELLISQPDTGEQAMEIVDALVRSGAVDAVVVDTVAALVPQAELEGEMGESHVGLQARLMSQSLRKIAGSVVKANCVVLFINQVREKIGVMFGPTETTPGGRALKFWAWVRIELRRSDWIKHGTEIAGIRAVARVVKNKVAPPFRRAEFDILFGRGIPREGCILDEATRLGIVEKAGSWYTYGEERLGQGRDNAVAYLAEHPELADAIEARVREAAGLSPAAALPASPDEEPPAAE